MKVKLILVALSSSILTAAAFAAAIPAKTYQVTGKVVQFTNDVITVQKGTEMLEFGKMSSSKIPGELVPGNDVTVTYRMMVVDVKITPAASTAKPSTAKPSTAKPAAPR